MTKLLQRAIAALEQLPADQQDVVAAQILTDVQDEQAWAARFEVTTDEQWERMAATVRQEVDSGETTSLDEAFPDTTPRR